MWVSERWILSRQPLSYVRTDGFRLEVNISKTQNQCPIVGIITELLGVEVHVVLEVFSAGEAAVKYLIRFIRALIGYFSVIPSVPGFDAHHVLT